MRNILLILFGLILLLILWFVEENDYFNTNYKVSIFDIESDLQKVYVSQFGADQYEFPRQNVDKVKLFKNIPFIGTLTAKTLQTEYNSDVIEFFNDSTNFVWSETTWSPSESEYILRFYNDKKIVGKIYLCLDNCGMVQLRPFTPNAKFGGLTSSGEKKLHYILTDEKKWK